MCGIFVYQQHVPKAHECWRLSAIELLRKEDDLLENMASNLKPSPIKRMCVCVCVHICVCVRMCVRTCVYLCVYVHVQFHVHVCGIKTPYKQGFSRG